MVFDTSDFEASAFETVDDLESSEEAAETKAEERAHTAKTEENFMAG